MDSLDSLGPFELLIVIVVFIISVLMIVAVLKLPAIAKYTKATMKLTALRAKKEGVDLESIRMTVLEADPHIFSNEKFESQIAG